MTVTPIKLGILLLLFLALGVATAGAGTLAYRPAGGEPDGPAPANAESPKAPAAKIAFSPDGKTLTVGEMTGNRTYDVATGEQVRRFLAASGFGTPAVVSPDGKLTAHGGFRDRVHVFDAVTGKELARPAGHQGPVLSAAFSPDGKALATGGADHTVRLWDAASGKELHALRGHSGGVTLLAFSPDGRHLATASGDANDRTVSWWDVATGREVRRFPGHGGGVESLAISAGGKALTVLDKSALVHIWNTETGEETRKRRGGDYAYGSVLTPDGKSVITLGGRPLALSVRDVNKDDVARTLEGAPPVFGLLRVSFSRDDRVMAMSQTDQAVQLWDLTTARALRRVTLKPDPSPVVANIFPAPPAFSPDGRVLAVANRGGEIALVELASGRARHVFKGGQGTVPALAFSPYGTRIVSGGEDGTALVWDVKAAAKAGPPPKDLDAAWSKLAEPDAPAAYAVIRALAAAPKDVVPYFRTHLSAAPGVEQKHMEKLIADLGSDIYDTRKKAEQELRKLGLVARPMLRQALKAKPSLDMTQRLEELLRAMDEWSLSGDELRAVRAVEVLEAAGTDEARGLLRELSKGTAGALLTEEAKQALARLETARR